MEVKKIDKRVVNLTAEEKEILRKAGEILEDIEDYVSADEGIYTMGVFYPQIFFRRANAFLSHFYGLCSKPEILKEKVVKVEKTYNTPIYEVEFRKE